MWRKKCNDLATIDQLLNDLTRFQQLKSQRWEEIDERVQMDIRPGVPSEDWIIPPDEEKTRDILETDPDYIRLKDALQSRIHELKRIAYFIRFDLHHDLDWVNFKNPLIGNSALEDGLKMVRRLRTACERKNYLIRNIF